MAEDSAVLERLDLLVGLLELAHHDSIERARDQIRSDEINGTILDFCAEERRAPKEIVDHVLGAVPKSSSRTIQRRLRELVARRALNEQGATSDKIYVATGLV
jgi:hypothetical protein